MEPLIVALILMAVSAFFGNKKKQDRGSSQKSPTDSRTSTRDRAQGGFKRMEDYAKEIYGEFQAQMNPEADKVEQVKEAARQVVERQKTQRPDRNAVAAAAKESSGRLSVHQKPVQQFREKAAEENRSPFPLTQNEAQKAIILAEVFMPPKSKRK